MLSANLECWGGDWEVGAGDHGGRVGQFETAGGRGDSHGVEYDWTDEGMLPTTIANWVPAKHHSKAIIKGQLKELETNQM